MQTVKQPEIPPDTYKRMKEFFMRTSIPRIYQSRLKEEAERKEKEALKASNREVLSKRK
ncbi:hypothetical protein [Lysinibacillus sp. NPDC047702]|uniref:hypothetical protein n=1 Tax=unclassified Lysinibacillus TaxID=2636778 RepID=UPI003D07091C